MSDPGKRNCSIEWGSEDNEFGFLVRRVLHDVLNGWATVRESE